MQCSVRRPPSPAAKFITYSASTASSGPVPRPHRRVPVDSVLTATASSISSTQARLCDRSAVGRSAHARRERLVRSAQRQSRRWRELPPAPARAQSDIPRRDLSGPGSRRRRRGPPRGQAIGSWTHSGDSPAVQGHERDPDWRRAPRPASGGTGDRVGRRTRRARRRCPCPPCSSGNSRAHQRPPKCGPCRPHVHVVLEGLPTSRMSATSPDRYRPPSSTGSR